MWQYCHLPIMYGYFFSVLLSLFVLIFFSFHGMLLLFIPLRGCGVTGAKSSFTQWAKARVHPEWVASSLQDLYWWQWLPHKVPTAHQEQFWGSVSCSRILRHVAQSHPRGSGDSNQWPSDHWSTSSTHWATAIWNYTFLYTDKHTYFLTCTLLITPSVPSSTTIVWWQPAGEIPLPAVYLDAPKP